jgi:UDP-N-acetylmuramoylalanine--D-glutamate ligase
MSALSNVTVKPQQAVYTLVVGLGKTGLSVVRYLHALGEAVVVVDSRDIPPGLNVLKSEYNDVKCITGKFDPSLFTAAHRIVVSPGVSLTEPALLSAKENNIEIIGDIDLFSHEVAAPVIGITGSNGKSTVTTLLTAMAVKSGIKAVAAGNIGTPVLEALADDVSLYVLELSSFQLETMHYLPMTASVVLNISADHLDRYDSLTVYAASKQAIYNDAETVVINRDDALASKLLVSGKNQLGFTLNEPAENEFGLREDEHGKVTLCFGQQMLVSADRLKMKGVHNLQNALAALAMGYAAGLPFPDMIEALCEFTGLRHRAQFVAEIDGINWINDSKATNVGATNAALLGLPGKHILIAGGVGKGADFSALSDVVVQHCHAVILIGKDADKIASVLPGSVRVEFANDMHAAVTAAQAAANELAQPGDNVLLAPACASFDMFDNFEHRGDAFIEAVEQLQSGVSA